MRILGFCKKWEKLNQDIFTTFRYPRRDRDWGCGESVQVIIQPRKKGGGDKLGYATIIEKEPKFIREITEEEAIEDGFDNALEMWQFLGKPPMTKVINKLTLKWINSSIET